MRYSPNIFNELEKVFKRLATELKYENNPEKFDTSRPMGFEIKATLKYINKFKQGDCRDISSKLAQELTKLKLENYLIGVLYDWGNGEVQHHYLNMYEYHGELYVADLTDSIEYLNFFLEDIGYKMPIKEYLKKQEKEENKWHVISKKYVLSFNKIGTKIKKASILLTDFIKNKEIYKDEHELSRTNHFK